MRVLALTSLSPRLCSALRRLRVLVLSFTVLCLPHDGAFIINVQCKLG